MSILTLCIVVNVAGTIVKGMIGFPTPRDICRAPEHSHNLVVGETHEGERKYEESHDPGDHIGQFIFMIPSWSTLREVDGRLVESSKCFGYSL